MVISFLNQKGGTGKSTLARSVAVEFLINKWAVHFADLDVKQQTSFKWADRRLEAEFKPAVEVVLYPNPKAALKAEALSDLLIIDGKAFADLHALDIAKASDLVVLPVGVSMDDLEPTLNLAIEFLHKGVPRKNILFVVTKVMDNGQKEAMNTRETIINWGFEVAQGWLQMKTAYSQAMDRGKSLTETGYKSLNQEADRLIQQISDKAQEDN